MKLFDYRRMRRNFDVKEITENQDMVMQYINNDRDQERLEEEREEQRPHGISLVVMDLDGTLTNSEKHILPETHAELMRLQRNGVRLVLASGRPTYGIMPLVRELEMDRFGGFILSYNGGLVIDCQTMVELHSQTLPAHSCRTIMEKAVADGHAVLGYRGTKILCQGTEPDIYAREEQRITKMDLVYVDDLLAELRGEEIVKLLVVGEPERLARTEADMQQLREEGIWSYRSQPFFLETVPAGIDKAQSLLRLLEHLHLEPRNMMAIGDGGNDVSMISLAGIGVAMQNATREAKDAADYVTQADNDHDGVGEALRKFALFAQ